MPQVTHNPPQVRSWHSCRLKLRAWLATVGLLCAASAAAQVVPRPHSSPPRPANSAATAELTPQGTPAPPEPEYLISPSDVLEVYVMDVPELSRQYEVSPSGKVTLPLLSAPLPAAGLTLSGFSSLARERLKAEGFVSDPRVSTALRESRAHAVAIAGAVKRPQVYRVSARTTLLDVLSQAEGLADDAGPLAIIRRGEIAMSVLRLRSPGVPTEKLQTATVDLERLLESGDSASNLDIYPGDRITVPRAGVVYVVGAVNRPGGFPLTRGKEGLSVLQALALAEDLKTSAVRQRAVIIRRDAAAPGGHRQVAVNLKKLLAGKATDPALHAEDILFVPDSSSRRALKRSAEAVLQITTGLAIYRF